MGTISFDFDDTLSHIEIQELAYRLKQMGYTIIICTARYDDKEKILNGDLFEVVHRLDLTEDDVIFCGGKPKHLLLSEVPNLLYHLDDNFHEAKGITLNLNGPLGLHILQDNWVNFKLKGLAFSEEQQRAQSAMYKIVQSIKEKQTINCIL